MDDRRFDALTRTLGFGASRRTIIRGLIGLGTGAATASIAGDGAEAARRGFSSPKLPTPPPCAQVGDACGFGCCSGTCCDGICLADGACCADSDCDRPEPCTIAVCGDDHTCGVIHDPSCGPDCSSCPFSDYCACVDTCRGDGSKPVEAAVCTGVICQPQLSNCPAECLSEIPCST